MFVKYTADKHPANLCMIATSISCVIVVIPKRLTVAYNHVGPPGGISVIFRVVLVSRHIEDEEAHLHLSARQSHKYILSVSIKEAAWTTLVWTPSPAKTLQVPFALALVYEKNHAWIEA